MDARRAARTTAVLGAAVFLFALALRLRGLGTVFAVDDEIMQFYEALGPAGWKEFFRVLAHNPHHVLLDPLGTRLAALGWDSLTMMRLPSALWGALGCWLVCRLGAREGKPGLGLSAGLLLSVSLLHLDWSRRADFYALLTAVSLWSVVDYLSVLDDPAKWPRLALSGSVFLLGHPYAVLMSVFQASFAFLTVPKERRPEVFRALFKAWSLAGAVFLPWFLFSTRSLLDASTFDFRGNPTTLRFGDFLAGLPAALALKPEAGAVPAWAAGLFAAAFAAGWASSLVGVIRGPRPRLLVFAHAVLAFALVAVVAADLRYHYYLAHRQLLWVLPFYLLAVADGWSRWLPAGAPRTLALAAAVAGALPPAAAVTAWQEARAEGMSRFAGQLYHLVLSGDEVGFENDQLLAGFLFYYDRPAFRRIADMRLVRGMMTYEFPPGFRVEHAAKTLAFVPGTPCAPARRWTVCGSIYDTGLLPPERLK
ncbi:MAG: glycosyltransferase family 39 protein [Elusimicrobia bacterium]|nr:glycosyltransferase family 39 protein [Elusimicrobiota bacterium]